MQPTQDALETTPAAGALVVSRTARALAEASLSREHARQLTRAPFDGSMIGWPLARRPTKS